MLQLLHIHSGVRFIDCKPPAAFGDAARTWCVRSCRPRGVGGQQSQSFSTRYITSYYWAITTISTVGFGDITGNTDGERLYSIMAEMFGCLMFAVLIAFAFLGIVLYYAVIFLERIFAGWAEREAARAARTTGLRASNSAPRRSSKSVSIGIRDTRDS